MSERAPKTHASQWSAIVDFVENHKQMVTHQFVGLSGRENYNKLWDELTTQLNSMGFGKKDAKKWQEVFGKWKSKVKVKVQDMVCGLKKTGGGGPLPQLTPIEERLMGIVGWKVVTGDSNLELGVENSFMADQPPPKTEAVKSQQGQPKYAAEIEESNQGGEVYLEVPPLVPFVPTPTMASSLTSITTPSRGSGSAENVTNQLRGKKRKRSIPQRVLEKSVTEMHKEHVAVLSNMNKNLERMADNQQETNKLLLEILASARAK